MSWAEDLLGFSVLAKDKGAVVKRATADLVKGRKYVMLLFSAHWCPPCRQFTPFMAELYADQDEGAEKAAEVVFVSSDQDHAAFNDYFGKEMPWAAVPYEGARLRQTLGAKYGVQGIPTLVILDAATGAVVTKDGRAAVMRRRSLAGPF